MLASVALGVLVTTEITNSEAAGATFNQQVAPILNSNCMTCHRPGGVGPFSLLTYDDAVKHAARIRAMVADRMMPPWYADPQFGVFKNARGLKQQQIDDVLAWIDGGTPEGSGTAPPPPPPVSNTGWSMNRPPDQILDLPFGQIALPASGELPTFTVWLKPLGRDLFVQAIEMRPSVQGVVHHSSLSIGRMPPGTTIGRGEAFPGGPALDGVAVYRDGTSKFGEYITDKPLLFYVPGGGFLQLADGLGKRFGPDDFIAWGLHLMSRGVPDTLRVQIGLWYARKHPHHEVKMWTVTEKLEADGRPLTTDARGQRQFPTIPAGAPNWPMTGTMRITKDITLYALWPHMHYRGKDMRFVVTAPNGKEETLLSVPHYNPHWQATYELAKPLKIRRGSTITAYGHFDNSSANPHNPDPNAVVKFGPQGTDEMFLPFLEVSVDDDDLSLEEFQRPQ